MRNFVGGLCCLIVALQILIGVPLVVSGLFYYAVGDGGPLVVEAHTGPRPAATIAPAEYPLPSPVSAPGPMAAAAPPRNVIPTAQANTDHPILQARHAQGSPLAGTVLEACDEDEELFLTALATAEIEIAKAEVGVESTSRSEPAAADSNTCGDAFTSAPCAVASNSNVEPLRRHLYAMADLDEQAGQYERADQWRGLARDLRSPQNRASQ